MLLTASSISLVSLHITLLVRKGKVLVLN